MALPAVRLSLAKSRNVGAAEDHHFVHVRPLGVDGSMRSAETRAKQRVQLSHPGFIGGYDWSSFASVAAVIPLRSLIGDLDPTVCKLHCAVWNGEAYPIDVLARSWNDWIGWNSWRGQRDDFNRRFIFSLAQARDNPSHWLFGGVFEVLDRRLTPGAWSYHVELRGDLMSAFVKRLMVAFRLPGRAVRLNLETHLDRIEVVSILAQPYAGEPFPGHDQINLRDSTPGR